MVEDFADDVGVLDASDDLDGAAAGLTGFDIDVEHPLETLGPSHGGMALGRRSIFWQVILIIIHTTVV